MRSKDGKYGLKQGEELLKVTRNVIIPRRFKSTDKSKVVFVWESHNNAVNDKALPETVIYKDEIDCLNTIIRHTPTNKDMYRVDEPFSHNDKMHEYIRGDGYVFENSMWTKVQGVALPFHNTDAVSADRQYNRVHGIITEEQRKALAKWIVAAISLNLNPQYGGADGAKNKNREDASQLNDFLNKIKYYDPGKDKPIADNVSASHERFGLLSRGSQRQL